MAISDLETPPLEDTIIDSAIDYKGRQVSRRHYGGWRSAGFIIGAGVAERLAFYGIGVNLIMYLTGPLGQSLANGAVNVNVWNGTATLLPILGAFVADSFLGCYRTIALASLFYVLGLGLLTLSAIMPYDCQRNYTTSCSPLIFQVVLFFFSLYLLAAAQSGIKPCVQTFGADQFDGDDKEEEKAKTSLFNWWHFGGIFSVLMAFSVVSYIQENFNWGLGFGIPCVIMVIGFVVFFLGTRTYRFKVTRNKKSPFIRISRVFITAFKNWRENPSFVTAHTESDKLASYQCSPQFNFLNKALKARNDTEEGGQFCSVAEVEEAKVVLRLLPVWGSCLIFGIVFAQPTTFFIKQASTLDRTVFSGFKIPPATIQCLASATIIVGVPIYNRILVPTARYFTGRPSGITMLQRIGTGIFISIIIMIIAALVGMKRLRIVREHGLIDEPHSTVPMSIWWMAPQIILFGVANVFGLVGVQEFFHDQVPKELRSIGIALNLSVFGVGSFLSGFLVWFIEQTTGGDGRDNWFSNNLNHARLDCFYWVLAGMSGLGFVSFLHIARSYVYIHNGP